MKAPKDRPLPEDRRRPHPTRLSPSHPKYQEILDAHEAALQAGEAMYVDPASGLWVQTAASIWARGVCCDLGCRHCPFVR